MTDGHITSGESDVHKLKNMVDMRYPTIFVGFGRHHDSSLLLELSNYLRGEYYFIDNIENSGYVYGEIVYNIIYHVVDAVQLTVRNGLIYNWKTNEWVADLEMANLPHDCEKLLHLMTYGNIHDIEIDVLFEDQGFSETQNVILSSVSFHPSEKRSHSETLYCYPPLLEIEDDSEPDYVVYFDSEKTQIQPVNLAKYHYRQKTQELLFESRVFMENLQKTPQPVENTNVVCKKTKIQNHKLKLRDYLRSMLDFMETHHFTDDLFMRRLGDDIYVLHNTIGKNDAGLWCASRQESQGRQQTYSATHFEESDEQEYSGIFTNMMNTPVLRREQTIKRSNISDNCKIMLRKSYNKGKNEQLSDGDDDMRIDRQNQELSNVDFWNEHRINNDFASLSAVSQNLANTIRSITTN